MSRAAQVPVALFITSFDGGGTERQTIELAARLNRERFAVHLVCLRAQGAWLERARGCAVSIVEFPITSLGRLSTLRQARRFAAWCRRERIAILQTCDFYANVFGLPAAALAGVPIRIGSRRGMNADRGAARRIVQRLAYAFAHRVVTNSVAAADQLVAEGVSRARIVTIPNGVAIAPVARRGREGTSRLIVTVGNLRPEKGHDTLIDAAARVAAVHPEARFEIAGDGPLHDGLLARARARGIADRVTFAGFQQDVRPLLARADLFVLPSVTEAFPNALLEAMACGVPSIATAVGGIPELVDDGRTGLLVPPRDAGALAGAIGALLDDPLRAAALGDAARRVVSARYAPTRMVGAYEALYENELRRRFSALRRPLVAEETA